MVTQSTSTPSCKYCQSGNVIKYGHYKDTQYYWCKARTRKFSKGGMPELGNTGRCIWIRDISDTESVCTKGFPPDERCWTGEDNPCWAFIRSLGELIE